MTDNQVECAGITVLASQSESDRFGRPVARLSLVDPTVNTATELERAADSTGADIVILRYPGVAAELFAGLTRFENYEPVYADTLLYWRWRDSEQQTLPPLVHGVAAVSSDAREIADLVRAVFADYSNHYAANPLISPESALEGYVEWVTDLVASESAICLTLKNPGSANAGFAVIDYASDPPDIRLAGIVPAQRGQGCYRLLMTEAMRHARDTGSTELMISTQAHNVAVMSAWARLGWTPSSAATTVHLVRRGLLG